MHNSIAPSRYIQGGECMKSAKADSFHPGMLPYPLAYRPRLVILLDSVNLFKPINIKHCCTISASVCRGVFFPILQDQRFVRL